MDTESTILTLTVNPTIDTSATTDHVLEERKVRCTNPQVDPGGGGLNAARAISRLGGNAFALYTSGGAVGAMLENLIELEGLNHRPIQIEQWTRQNFIVFEEANERQFRFGLPGPTLNEEEWKALLDEISKHAAEFKWIVASGSLPPGTPADFYARVARIAHEKNARLILDTSGEPLRKALEEGVYLVKPNLRELGDFLQRDLADEEQQERAIADLVESGKTEIAVLSLGGGGALYKESNSAGHLHAPSVIRRSAVGAGDSMVGAMALALSRSLDVPDAIRFGVAAGSAAVMTPGTQLCSREETKKLYHWMKERPD